MHLVLFGATGQVGAQVLTQALEAGHQVTAIARDISALPKHERLHARQAQLHEQDKLIDALKGADVVISCLGLRKNDAQQAQLMVETMQTILKGMSQHKVPRLIAISGAATFLPDDKLPFGRRAIRAIMTLVAKHVLQSKEREYELIKDSDVDWVLVRPPRIVKGALTKTYRVFPDDVPSPKISSADVAHFILSCLEGDQWLRQGPIPGY